MVIEDYKNSEEALSALTEALIGMMARKGPVPFNLALSGGESAKRMYELWVKKFSDRIDWKNLHLFWVDERCVDPTNSESNYGEAARLLLTPLSIPAANIHRIQGEIEPGTEAMRYSREVRECLPRSGNFPYFDCIILGIGTDFHTASIFQDSLHLLTDSRNYAVSRHPMTGIYRVTMTGHLILAGSPLLIPMLGQEKVPVLDALRKVKAFTSDTPAAYVLSRAVDVRLFCSKVI